MENKTLVKEIVQDFQSKYKELPKKINFQVFSELFDSVDKFTSELTSKQADQVMLDVMDYLEDNLSIECHL